MENSQEVTTSYRLTYPERLRAAWDLLFGSPLTILWIAFFPSLGAVLLWVNSWPTSRSSGWDYLVAAACFAFVPLMLLWNTYRAHRADRKNGPYTYRFRADGIHVTTPTSELTHRWPAISRLRKKGDMLYLYFTKTCAHCVPLRVLPSATALITIEQLATAGGVRRVGA